MDVGKSAADDDDRHFCRLGTERLTVSDNVCDLGVVVDSQLRFSEHITKIVRKAHHRANLIHCSFTSKDRDTLVKAFNVYVRSQL